MPLRIVSALAISSLLAALAIAPAAFAQFANLGSTANTPRVGTSSFLTPTATLNPREFQLGARLRF